MKSKLEIAVGLLSLLITLPIWYYLFYKILVMVGATELMWFLYWIYVPVGVVLATISKIIEAK